MDIALFLTAMAGLAVVFSAGLYALSFVRRRNFGARSFAGFLARGGATASALAAVIFLWDLFHARQTAFPLCPNAAPFYALSGLFGGALLVRRRTHPGADIGAADAAGPAWALASPLLYAAGLLIVLRLR